MLLRLLLFSPSSPNPCLLRSDFAANLGISFWTPEEYFLSAPPLEWKGDEDGSGCEDVMAAGGVVDEGEEVEVEVVEVERVEELGRVRFWTSCRGGKALR